MSEMMQSLVGSLNKKAIANAVMPRAMSACYEPGAIVYNAWGYDQTNIDFYVIEKRSGDFVTLRPMTDERHYDAQRMSGDAEPGEPRADAPTLRRKVRSRDGKEIGLQIESYGWCQLWDGWPKSYSTYA